MTDSCVAFCTTFDEQQLDLLRNRRKYYIAEREYMLAEQRKYQRDDNATARFFAVAAKDMLKHERAVTLVLDHIMGRTAKLLRPVELDAYITHEIGAVEYMFTKEMHHA